MHGQGCSKVKGGGLSGYVCDHWKRRERYLIRLEKAAAEGVLIFPFGTYFRGKERRTFTREHGREMVKNFKTNILEREQSRLPMNREHERTAGRVGWLTDVWVADDGVRGRVETAPGKDGLLSDFEYLSPEVKWEWTHPYSGEGHRNVLMGIALTNYPYLLGRMSMHGDRVQIFKGEAGGFEILDAPARHGIRFAHLDLEKQIAYGIVLEPFAQDAHGDVLEPEDVEEAAHYYMEFGEGLDAHHQREVEPREAVVVETWIQRESTVWLFAGRRTEVPEGAWCMGVKFNDDDLWQEVLDGEITGFSPVGWGTREEYGGDGSGNWDHDGRPGKRGGSAPGGGLQRIGVGSDSTVAERREASRKARAYSIHEPSRFYEAVDRSINPKYEAFVTKYTPEQYREMGAECYVSESGNSGYALKPDGDIISVFSYPGSGEGAEALISAIRNGGTKLDCFDGFLPQFYSQFGFQEYDRWAWDDQYAPDGWNYDEFGRPDVVFMRLVG